MQKHDPGDVDVQNNGETINYSSLTSCDEWHWAPIGPKKGLAMTDMPSCGRPRKPRPLNATFNPPSISISPLPFADQFGRLHSSRKIMSIKIGDSECQRRHEVSLFHNPISFVMNS